MRLVSNSLQVCSEFLGGKGEEWLETSLLAFIYFNVIIDKGNEIQCSTLIFCFWFNILIIPIKKTPYNSQNFASHFV